MGWGGRWKGGSGWGTHVHSWLIHVNVWQKPLQYCKVISLQLKQINFLKSLKKRWKMHLSLGFLDSTHLLHQKTCSEQEWEGERKPENLSIDYARPAWCSGKMIIYHSEFILTITMATFIQRYMYSGNHITHAAALISTTTQWDINISCFTDEETETQKVARVSELISTRAKIQIVWLQNL